MIDRLLTDDIEGFRYRRASGGDFEIRFALEQPAQALTEQLVIVHQKYSNLRNARLCHRQLDWRQPIA